MIKRTLSSFTVLIALCATAQETMDQAMEKRAREFHRVLGLTDREVYKQFMKDNYTKEFLEKPVKLSRTVSESDGRSTASTTDKDKSVDNLDAKAQMYAQLHSDFGGSPIKSLTLKENKIEMFIESSSLNGKFTLVFSKNKPYLIDGMSIEAETGN